MEPMLTASRSEDTRLTVRVHGGAPLAEAFHFPLGLPSARELDVGLHHRGAVFINDFRQLCEEEDLNLHGSNPTGT